MKQSYTIPEAAKAIGVGITKTYELINTHQLPARKLGKRTLILKEDLDAFLSGLQPYKSENMGA